MYFCTRFQRDEIDCPGGGMVDTVDSKSAARKGVRVQVPPGVQDSTDIQCYLRFQGALLRKTTDLLQYMATTIVAGIDGC